MIEKYKHVIWDWNGTLLNDVALAVEVINKLITKRGMPALSVDRYRDIFGFPVRDYYVSAGFDFAKESFEKVGKEWIDEYERGKLKCSLHAGAVKALDAISSLKIGQSILSASSLRSLEEAVRHYGLSRYFLHLYGLDTIYAPSKVDLGKKLIAELWYKKGETLLVGDTEHDLETAAAIGADCVLIARGHQSRERLEKTGAPVLADAQELI